FNLTTADGKNVFPSLLSFDGHPCSIPDHFPVSASQQLTGKASSPPSSPSTVTLVPCSHSSLSPDPHSFLPLFLPSYSLPSLLALQFALLPGFNLTAADGKHLFPSLLSFDGYPCSMPDHFPLLPPPQPPSTAIPTRYIAVIVAVLLAAVLMLGPPATAIPLRYIAVIVTVLLAAVLMFGVLCSCLVCCAHVWCAVLMFGVLCSCLVCCAHVWCAVLVFGVLCSCLVCCARVWCAVLVFGVLCSCLVCCARVWCAVLMFGVLCSCLVCCAHVWCAVLMFGVLCSCLVCCAHVWCGVRF
ncbi:unnamed protein product, partial [Closterium sp. NIES-65]